jgi:hypothetical protein
MRRPLDSGGVSVGGSLGSSQIQNQTGTHAGRTGSRHGQRYMQRQQETDRNARSLGGTDHLEDSEGYQGHRMAAADMDTRTMEASGVMGSMARSYRRSLDKVPQPVRGRRAGTVSNSPGGTSSRELSSDAKVGA